MATYAAFQHVELYNVGKTKKRVLRPPGGGSSGIFGAETPSTPRSVRNPMASNIFGSNSDSAVKNSGDAVRRGGHKNVDSHSRLFGEPERPFTPAKNHMKSSIPIGGADGKVQNGSGPGSVNGNSSAKNGNDNGNGNAKMENGNREQQNGVSKTETQESQELNESQEILSENQIQEINNQINQENCSQLNQETNNCQESEDINNIASNTQELYNTQEIPLNSDSSPNSSSSEKTNQHNGQILTNGDNINNFPTTNDCKQMDMNGNSSSATSSTSQTTSSAVSPASNASSNNKVRSPRFSARNPVTGIGVEIPIDKYRRQGKARDGNPVTGEGYKPAGAEINTTIPCLNGANQVINKNRIPPGGYSSGLW